MELIKNILNESKKLEFLFTDEGYKEDLDKLNNIFFNSSPSGRLYMEHMGYILRGDDDENKFIKHIHNRLINIYEYEYKLHDKPKNKEEEIEYEHLDDIGRSRSSYIRTDLYWNAYNLLKQKGYTFKNITPSTTYMNICKLINSDKKVTRTLDVWLKCGDIVNDVVLRCGDIDANRALMELKSNDYLIIFPFIKELCFYNEDKDNVKIGKMYTIEMTEECKLLLKKEWEERRKHVRNPYVF